MELREYQKECIRIIDNMDSGTGLVQMAIGLDKTSVFTSIKRKGRVLILSHTDELVHQPETYYHDCSFGVEQNVEHSHGEDVVSSSVKTLANRLTDFQKDAFDTIITDEAHHAVAPSYLRIYEYFKPRLHIGFTATPNRGDKVRLDTVYEKIIYQRDLKWGINNGYLCDINFIPVELSYDLTNIKVNVNDGDFRSSELEQAVNTDMANFEVANAYRKYADGSTVIFESSISQAENIAKNISGAVAIHSKTTDRRQIMEDFKDGKINCLVNCNILTESVDLPFIKTVIIARPTKNVNLYTQMVGRGMQRIEEEKDVLKLIDCVGVSDSIDICTAPTLMGLDLKNIPKERRKNINGSLKNLENNLIKQCDSPDSWILDYENVRSFGKEQNIDLHNINFSLLYNDDLFCNMPESKKGVNTKCRIFIKAIDNLGNTQFVLNIYNRTDNNKLICVKEEAIPMRLQQAVDSAYLFLCKFYKKQRNIWDLQKASKYMNEKATQRQIDIINKRLTKAEISTINVNDLSKGMATQIINHLDARR